MSGLRCLEGRFRPGGTLNDGVHDGSFIPELLLQNGLRLRTFKEEEIDLEDVFMGFTKGITK